MMIKPLDMIKTGGGQMLKPEPRGLKQRISVYRLRLGNNIDNDVWKFQRNAGDSNERRCVGIHGTKY